MSQLKRRYLAAYFVLLAALCLTGVASYYALSSVRLKASDDFNRQAREIQGRVRTRMHAQEIALSQVRGLFSADRAVTATEFRDYVSAIDLTHEYPGALGVGYAKRLDESRTKILYLEPLEWRNKRAIGFDMFSDPVRRAAMEKSRDSGQPTASGIVTLVQETDVDTQSGFLVYVPIYSTKGVPPTVGDRRRKLLGYVFSPFRVRDLFDDFFASAKNDGGLSVAVYDGDEAKPERRIYALGVPIDYAVAKHASRETMLIANHTWTVEVARAHELPHSRAPWLTALLGLILSGALFQIVRLSNRHTESVMAEERAVLEERRIVETLNHIGSLLASQLELDKLLQALTDATREICGAAYCAFFYTVLEDDKKLMLYTLSGAPRERFEFLGKPRATPIFAPTFRGEAIMRSDDITKDPRYGHNPPNKGFPEGHLPIRAYLSAPVISRSGEVLGGLFLGHPLPGVFTERAERIIAGIARQAASAIDNAKIYGEAKSAVTRLEESLGELERSNQELRQFAHVASHDLKEPLRMVTNYVQLLERRYGPSLDADGREFIAYAVEGSRRMYSLIDDLLAYSRVQMQAQPLAMTSTNEALDVALDNLKLSLRESGAHITRGELPSLRADGSQLVQLFQNLVGNALKYRGEAAPAVAIAAVREGRFWKYSVRDNGIGIAPQYADRIFVLFQRLHGRTEYSGTGIGLAICKKIVERHGGKIWVESEPGQGATFYFTLAAE